MVLISSYIHTLRRYTRFLAFIIRLVPSQKTIVSGLCAFTRAALFVRAPRKNDRIEIRREIRAA